MPDWIAAGLWGLLAASALVVGAAVPYLVELSHRWIAAIMGFGGGVLISVMSIELLEKAYEQGGAVSMTSGFLGGAVLFSGINWGLSKRGAKDRNRCGECVTQPKESDMSGSGLAIAAGALVDGIPESLVLGLDVTHGGGISVALLGGFFLANIPQGLSSASGMKQAGRSKVYVFGVWGTMVVLAGAAAAVGAVAFANASPMLVAMTTGVAAGAILAMLAETMIPEAVHKAQHFIGLITVAGFLCAFMLAKLAL